MPADHQARTTKAADRNAPGYPARTTKAANRNAPGYLARTTKARPLISSTTKES